MVVCNARALEAPASFSLIIAVARRAVAFASAGQCDTTVGRKQFWRRRKLRSQVEMTLDDGTVVASGTVSGMGVQG